MNWRPIGELQHDRDERPQVAKCTPIQLAICQNWDKIAVERVIMKKNRIIPIGKIRRRRKSLVLLILELMENSIEQASERE